MATLRGGGGIKVLKMYYVVCDWSLKCAFTGSASSAIDGQTLHRAFSLTFADRRDDGKYKSLNDKTKEKMTTVLKNLRLGNYLRILNWNISLRYFQS